MAAVVVVVLLLIVDLVVIGMVLAGSRDQDLSVRRLDAIESMYAAEAGMNMALREFYTCTDEDGDGVVGSISDDANDADDPSIGGWHVVVTRSNDTPVAPKITLSSAGRYGSARRKIDVVLDY